jgi:hypothetical protein
VDNSAEFISSYAYRSIVYQFALILGPIVGQLPGELAIELASQCKSIFDSAVLGYSPQAVPQTANATQ